MPDKVRMLIDVDGVVGDLMGGFIRYLADEHIHITRDLITRHKIHKSPGLSSICKIYDLDGALTRFLQIKDVYQRFVTPLPRSVQAIESLREIVEPIFVTAVLKTAPSSYESKFLWCREHFGDVPFYAVPSTDKHSVAGVFAVDDRYDICERYERSGKKTFLYGQPWNEAPPAVQAYGWPGIVECVQKIVRRWDG